jgi:hypothetical protein
VSEDGWTVDAWCSNGEVEDVTYAHKTIIIGAIGGLWIGAGVAALVGVPRWVAPVCIVFGLGAWVLTFYRTNIAPRL